MLSSLLGALLLSVPAWAAPSRPEPPRLLGEDERLVVLPESEERRFLSWEQIFNRAGIEFGVWILGRDPYGRNQDVLIPPASTSKLFTSALALERFGAEHRFRTDVTWERLENGDLASLTLTARGDPTWAHPDWRLPSPPSPNPAEDFSDDRLAALVDRLKAEGVKRVRLPIQVLRADPRWAAANPPSTWASDDPDWCYGVRPDALTFGTGCATYELETRTRGKFLDASIPAKVELAVAAGSSTSLSQKAILDPSSGAWKIRITGTLKSGASRAERQLRLPIHESLPWLARKLSLRLQQAGIELSSAPTTSPRISRGALELSSPPLSLILQSLNKDSVNVIAETLFLAAGLEAFPSEPDPWSAGRALMRNFLDSLGPDFANTSLRDGSGVSRSSQSTARALVQLLERFKGRPTELATLWESLPIAGVDGTLKKRMIGTAAQGRLRAKTGTLSGHYNLSGFAPRMDPATGRPAELVSFTILTRTTSSQSTNARAAADLAGAKLCEGLSAQGPALE